MMKKWKNWKVCVVFALMLIVMLIPEVPAFANIIGTPERPPGPLGNTDSVFKKIMGWLMWLTPFTVAGICGYLFYTGMFGVKDNHKRAATKETMFNVGVYGAGVFCIVSIVYAIFEVMGIK